jgi:hypothetical protein
MLAKHIYFFGITLWLLRQDFAVPGRAIMELWRVGKISDATCKRDMNRVREVGVQRITQFFAWREEHANLLDNARLTASIMQQEQASCKPFHHHPAIQVWLQQYAQAVGEQYRFKTLLLRGPSRSGKTQKACSIFGFEHTLVGNCQGMGAHLPYLGMVDRSLHRALVLDEASYEQVVGNKQFFQAGARSVRLGQSPCNQHSYSVFVYMLPIILCSNVFPMSQAEGLSADDEDWLQANVVDVPAPVAGKWWVDDLEWGLDEA